MYPPSLSSESLIFLFLCGYKAAYGLQYYILYDASIIPPDGTALQRKMYKNPEYNDKKFHKYYTLRHIVQIVYNKAIDKKIIVKIEEEHCKWLLK